MTDEAPDKYPHITQWLRAQEEGEELLYTPDPPQPQRYAFSHRAMRCCQWLTSHLIVGLSLAVYFYPEGISRMSLSLLLLSSLLLCTILLWQYYREVPRPLRWRLCLSVTCLAVVLPLMISLSISMFLPGDTAQSQHYVSPALDTNLQRLKQALAFAKGMRFGVLTKECPAARRIPWPKDWFARAVAQAPSTCADLDALFPLQGQEETGHQLLFPTER